MSLLRWAFVLAIIAIIAGVLGFTDIAGASWEVAKFLFWIFLAGVLILLALGMFAARAVTGP